MPGNAKVDNRPPRVMAASISLAHSVEVIAVTTAVSRCWESNELLCFICTDYNLGPDGWCMCSSKVLICRVRLEQVQPEITGVGVVKTHGPLPAARLFPEPLQVSSVKTSKCLFGLQAESANVLNSAVALSLTLALAMITTLCFIALAPAAK